MNTNTLVMDCLEIYYYFIILSIDKMIKRNATIPIFHRVS